MACFNKPEQVDDKINEATKLLKMQKIEDVPRDNPQVLFLEPYYNSTHMKLLNLVTATMQETFYTLIKISPKYWHGRSKISALWMSTQIPLTHTYKVLFCSSLLPLAELIALRPDLANVHKFVYFHENHLESAQRFSTTCDHVCGYNEIMSCIVADHILFNTKFNETSFLSKVIPYLMHQPDNAYVITDLEINIANKCKVVYYPLDIITMDTVTLSFKEESKELQIVWPYRFESLENEDMLFTVLHKLEANGYKFKIMLLASIIPGPPEIMLDMIDTYEQNKNVTLAFFSNDYPMYVALKKADVIVSAAYTEFFGVTVMEAIYCGCIPVVPKRHAFKELYGSQIVEMYRDPDDMYKILSYLCYKKMSGTLNHNYSHLVTQFDSRHWFRTVFETYDCVNFDE